jgi:predicted MFS family arabinose efflux permease
MMGFIFLAAGLFVLGCDDYIFAGLLPGISGSFQSSIAGAAQGISVYGITYVAALPVCVFLLTKRPARQVLLLGLMTFIAGDLITLMSTNLGVYMAGRAIAGIGAGLYLPLAIATAGELVEPAAKGRALSLAWGSNAAGAVIGIPIGLWLADISNWRVTICMILLLSLVALVGLLLRKLDLKVAAPPTLREQASLLVDRGVMSVIGITLLCATSGFGLYVYTAPVLSGSATSPAAALSLWNIGGLIGSLTIGYAVDRVEKPQWVMAAILTMLLAAYLSIPVLRSIPVLGLLPFFIWGAMGWSTMTPQQCRLSELKPGHDATLVALNSSAVSLGGVAGPALGGLALASGFNAQNLPYAAVVLVSCALAWQLLLLKPFPKEVPA